MRAWLEKELLQALAARAVAYQAANTHARRHGLLTTMVKTPGRWVNVKKIELVDGNLYVVRRIRGGAHGNPRKPQAPCIALWKDGWQAQVGEISTYCLPSGSTLEVWVQRGYMKFFRKERKRESNASPKSRKPKG